MSISIEENEFISKLQGPFQAELEALCAANEFSGAVRVAKADSVLFEGAWGYGNRAWKVPNTTDTLFRTASVSKVFTALAILQLVDQKKLRLEDRVHDILPLEDSAIPESVTLRHLITHTSGIADYFPDDESWPEILNSRPTYTLKSVQDFVSLFSHLPPKFEPGEKYFYCNAGFVLLGRVVEVVTGRNYFDVVRDQVFQPAGMPTACSPQLDEVHERLAEPYEVATKDDGTVVWKRCITGSIPPAPDGGMAATPAEFESFWAALTSGKLISHDLLKDMLSPQVEMEPGWHYGLGLYIVQSDEEPLRYEAHGFDAGANAFIAHYPQLDLRLSVLSNLDDGAMTAYAKLRSLIASLSG